MCNHTPHRLLGDAGRGAIIDQYGPGTVYHRLLAREKQFAEQRERSIYRGAGIIGAGGGGGGGGGYGHVEVVYILNSYIIDI